MFAVAGQGRPNNYVLVGLGPAVNRSSPANIRQHCSSTYKKPFESHKTFNNSSGDYAITLQLIVHSLSFKLQVPIALSDSDLLENAAFTQKFTNALNEQNSRIHVFLYKF